MADPRGMQRPAWDHTTHPDFYNYYATASQSEATAGRFRRVQALVLRVAAQNGLSGPLDVADIGCGAGTQSRMWAERGHRVFGVDVSEPLIELARQRAQEHAVETRFEVGSATTLPWADGSMDVCLMPELLEHVADWKSCITEAARVLRRGGVLYLSTTNVLCPRQDEYNLPLYSWYPARLKRYYERAAVTTRPDVANYATYPAVHWFSYYGLRDYLRPLGFRCLDRFDLIDVRDKGRAAALVVRLARGVPLLRLLGHVATPGTWLIAVKQGGT